MTTVYFIRHAEPNYDNHDDESRELTKKGLKDRELVTRYLEDKEIDAVLSSPYKRAMDTVKDFADKHHFTIEPVYDFRERRVDSEWIEDFTAYCKQQWEDFSYRRLDGETLGEVQSRNIGALREAISKYRDKNIVVGSHGTALSTIINYFDASFGYAEFEKIKYRMPWAVKVTFDGNTVKHIETVDLFALGE